MSLSKPPLYSLLSVMPAHPEWRQQSQRLAVPAAMASAVLILAGLHLHHLERGDSDLFPESTFLLHNRALAQWKVSLEALTCSWQCGRGLSISSL